MSSVPLLMDSFWFTESPLRLGLDICFSSCPTLPWVHPLSTSVSNDYFLRKSYNQCFIPLILDLPTTNVKTFFFRCVLLASVGIWLFGGSSVQQHWLSYQHQPSITFVSFSFPFTPHWIVLSDYINLSDKRWSQSFHNLLQTCFILFKLNLGETGDKPLV